MEDIPQEIMPVVMSQLNLMRLTMAFKEKYGDDAFDILRSYMGRTGKARGEELKGKLNITGDSIHDIRNLFEAIVSPAGLPPKITIEGNKMIVERSEETKCPFIYVAKETGMPLQRVCDILAKPMAVSALKTVNPSVEHSFHMVTNDNCKEIYEIK